jgi:predicted phage baseplate assembly protein
MLATPAALSNEPGLDAIARRVGTHGRFLDSMLARLSSPAYPELVGLRARTADDLAIALLDCWAVIADILAFYTERIANEGYLRTATEPESIARLGRLVGFTPRPGLGASVFLTYTLLIDPARDTTVTIPAGSRAQSVPGPGELPQSFETSADLPSRASWNDLKVQQTAPALISADTTKSLTELHLAGTDTQVRAGDQVLLVFTGSTDAPQVLTVRAVTADAVAGRTTVQVQNDFLSGDYTEKTAALLSELRSVVASPPPGPAAQGFLDYLIALPVDVIGGSDGLKAQARFEVIPPEKLLQEIGLIQPAIDDELAFAGLHGQAAITAWLTPLLGPLDAARQAARQILLATQGPAGLPGPPVPQATGPGAAVKDLGAIVAALRRPASQPPATPFALARSPAERFAAGSDTAAQLLIAADPRLGGVLYDAWSHQQIGAPSPLHSLLHLRVTAAPFGATAPHQQPSQSGGLELANTTSDWPLNETDTQLCLDTVYDGIVAGSWVVIQRPASLGQPAQLITMVTQVDTIARDDYGITARVTRLTLKDAWLPAEQAGLTLTDIRPVVVHVQGVPLSLSPSPVTGDIAGDSIDLDHPYPGLQPGRWLVVSGERTDIPGTTGVDAAELVMLAGVNQVADPTLPGEMAHSQLLLAAPLGYRYRRDSVHVAGNVAAATQGETKTETLGSGDAGQPGQVFALKQSPLTWLPAATPTGAADTLEVRVDGVRWHQVDTLADSGPADHDYVLRTGADGRYSVAFGDGQQGSRLTTGVGNVTATYRIGLGRAGDVTAGQVSQLATRPQGVGGVTNPVRASGGVDPDDTELARRATPLRMLALDRLVSVRDYEDFARARAGIGTASATKLTDGHRQVVHVTVAGTDDAPLDDTSALVTALQAAYAENGDPHQPVQVAVRALVLLILGAGIHIGPDYEWPLVAAAVRAALLSRFGARRQELGQPVYLSQVVATMQAVPGVDYLEVDTFAGVPGDSTPEQLADFGSTLGQPGQVVLARLATYQPRSYSVQDGDTLSSVAAANGLTVTELVGLNPGLTGTDLTQVPTLVVWNDILPAQLARFDPDLPDTIALHEVRP